MQATGPATGPATPSSRPQMVDPDRRLGPGVSSHILTCACNIDSPSPLQARPAPSERQFEEWPREYASLKRVTEADKTTFQIQFEWTPGSPDSCQRHADRSESLPRKSRGLPKASLSDTRSSSEKWTSEEDNIVRRMRQDSKSWANIRCALPHRSVGTIQVRYSTKLTKKGDVVGHQAGPYTSTHQCWQVGQDHMTVPFPATRFPAPRIFNATHVVLYVDTREILCFVRRAVDSELQQA